MNGWTKHKWAPDHDKEWRREYLGEWVKPAPGPFATLNTGRSGKREAVRRHLHASLESMSDGHTLLYATPHGDVLMTKTSTTCARCSHTFTAKPDGFVDEALENEIAAHRERCVIVGDWVRWEHPTGRWIEGPVIGEAVLSAPSDLLQSGQRMADAARKAVGLHDGLTEAEIIEATKYDGVTGRECYERYVANQRSEQPLYMSMVHIAAARDLWGLYLKAKIAASAESERARVRVELQDLE